MELENTSAARIEALYEKQRQFYNTGKTRDLAWRKTMLKRFEEGLRKWEKPLCDALRQDLTSPSRRPI